MYTKKFEDMASMEKFLMKTKKKEFVATCYLGDTADGNFVVASRTQDSDEIRWIEFENGQIADIASF